MGQEMCPRCGTLRNVQVTVSRREVVDAEGKSGEVVTRTYHCETCHSFVRSKDVETVEE